MVRIYQTILVNSCAIWVDICSIWADIRSDSCAIWVYSFCHFSRHFCHLSRHFLYSTSPLSDAAVGVQFQFNLRNTPFRPSLCFQLFLSKQTSPIMKSVFLNRTASHWISLLLLFDMCCTSFITLTISTRAQSVCWRQAACEGFETSTTGSGHRNSDRFGAAKAQFTRYKSF